MYFTIKFLAIAVALALVISLAFHSIADAHKPRSSASMGDQVTVVQDLGELERAVRNWKRVTGITACGGSDNIELAWHNFPPGKAWAHAHSSCRIHFDPTRVKRMRELRGDCWLRILVSHEVGHLAHRKHAKRGIMQAKGVTTHSWCS